MVTDILYIKHVLLDAFRTISVALLHSQNNDDDDDNFKVTRIWPKQQLSIFYYEYHVCSST